MVAGSSDGGRRPRWDPGSARLPGVGRVGLAGRARTSVCGAMDGSSLLLPLRRAVLAGAVIVSVGACGLLPAPAAPSDGSPTPAASASPGGSGAPSACPIESTKGRLASNRLLDVVVDPAGTWVRFVFGSPTGPAGEGSLEAAQPPFDRTASGLPIEVLGERVVRLHFEALLLFDDLGNPTYGGPDRLRPSTGPIRDVVVEEAFEGVMNWLVGFDGPACVRLRQGLDPLSLELVVAPTE
ncbi:MAG: hypothetical protein KatS3mg065_0604 [Chloroflexota bacterium]|nr:MAG: hypothetical protein KatS3mg065_0604 [Chloroflexota bacterium]